MRVDVNAPSNIGQQLIFLLSFTFDLKLSCTLGISLTLMCTCSNFHFEWSSFLSHLAHGNDNRWELKKLPHYWRFSCLGFHVKRKPFFTFTITRIMTDLSGYVIRGPPHYWAYLEAVFVHLMHRLPALLSLHFPRQVGHPLWDKWNVTGVYNLLIWSLNENK